MTDRQQILDAAKLLAERTVEAGLFASEEEAGLAIGAMAAAEVDRLFDEADLDSVGVPDLMAMTEKALSNITHQMLGMALRRDGKLN